jgi:predicted  nucleic acid-binding Zn-ribbon protein
MPEYKERTEPCQYCGSIIDHDTKYCETTQGIKKWMPNPIDNDNAMAACTDLKEPENLERRVKAMSDRIERMKAEKQELMSLIGDVLQEAQEHPQRLIAFNSPLLGMLLLHYHAHISGTEVDERAIQQFKAAITMRDAP